MWNETVTEAGITDTTAQTQVAKLKGLMRDCKHLAERASKRNAEGLPAVDFDVPLPADVQADTYSKASDYYRWSRWEFRLSMVTLLSICKVKCQALSAKSQPRHNKHKVSDKVSVIIEDGTEEYQAAGDLFSWNLNFQILVAGWAIAAYLRCCS